MKNMDPLLPQHYRELLKRELLLRIQKNPQYSLRAFARDLKLASPRLSEVISGKKGLSRLAASMIAKRLGLNEEEQTFFCDLVDQEHARSPLVKKEAKKRIANYFLQQNNKKSEPNLTLEALSILEEWYPLAIVQYLKIKNVNQTPQAVARSFGLTRTQVALALENLKKLELVEEKKGIHTPTRDWVMASSFLPSASIRKFHEQMLDLAKQALGELPKEERSFRSNTFPTRLQNLPEIEAKIKKFSQELIAQYSAGTEDAEVVALNLQCFPLTKNRFGVNS